MKRPDEDSQLIYAVPAPRVVRVFVSSTFHDMEAEREELVKRIFPQLRRLCRERGVAWGEVDLRWGITEEQSQRGEVLPICLAEIQRCRPYFIGLLGDRYGWVPDEIPEELIQQEPWLAEHLHHSITELEILHGVLNNPQLAGRAFFYFRDPGYIDSLPPIERDRYREVPLAEEIRQFGEVEAVRRAAERRRRMEALKQRIRGSGLPVSESYHDPRALGELVLTDLTNAVNRLFPEGSAPNLLDREAAEHDAYASSRFRIYIGRQEYFDRLDAHAGGDGQPLVVLGESGSGKSAMLANWGERYRKAHPTELVFMHFIGATPESADWAAMLRRLIGEFRRRFGITQEVPDQPSGLRVAFANALQMVADRGRAVVILDALNQLEERDQATTLDWLPPKIPANIRLVLSTLPGRPLEDLKRRQWPTIRIEPLTFDERGRLITDYFAQFAKTLDQTRLARIANAPPTTNPLYLCVLLDELRQFGIYERLNERIDHYLAAESVGDLYQKVLARYEEDYERERPGLVRDAMSLLWAARRGLAETELLDILGANDQPLPRAHWSALFLAAESSFVDRCGLLNFAHDQVRRAVKDRYLSAVSVRDAVLLNLAAYFERDRISDRAVDELPRLLLHAQANERLFKLLTDLDFFKRAYHSDEYEVRSLWTQLETKSEFQATRAWEVVRQKTPPDEEAIWSFCILLQDLGHLDEALAGFIGIYNPASDRGESARATGALANIAELFRRKGQLTEALEFFRRLETGDAQTLARALHSQSLIMIDLGKYTEAAQLATRAEAKWKELGDVTGRTHALFSQATVAFRASNYEMAWGLLSQANDFARTTGDLDNQQSIKSLMASVCHYRGQLDRARRLFLEVEETARQLGHLHVLESCLGNRAVIAFKQGNAAQALELMAEQEAMCRRMGQPEALMRSLGNQAAIQNDLGNVERALELHREEEQLCRSLSNLNGLLVCLNNQALIHEKHNNLAEALRLLKEQEQVARQIGSPEGLRAGLMNQARIRQDQGDLVGALDLLEEVGEICRILIDAEGAINSLGRRADLLAALGREDELLPLSVELERTALASGNFEVAATALGNQGYLHLQRGNLSAAALAVQRAQGVCRAHGLESTAQRIAPIAAAVRAKNGA